MGNCCNPSTHPDVQGGKDRLQIELMEETKQIEESKEVIQKISEQYLTPNDNKEPKYIFQEGQEGSQKNSNSNQEKDNEELSEQGYATPKKKEPFVDLQTEIEGEINILKHVTDQDVETILQFLRKIAGLMNNNFANMNASNDDNIAAYRTLKIDYQQLKDSLPAKFILKSKLDKKRLNTSFKKEDNTHFNVLRLFLLDLMGLIKDFLQVLFTSKSSQNQSNILNHQNTKNIDLMQQKMIIVGKTKIIDQVILLFTIIHKEQDMSEQQQQFQQVSKEQNMSEQQQQLQQQLSKAQEARMRLGLFLIYWSDFKLLKLNVSGSTIKEQDTQYTTLVKQLSKIEQSLQYSLLAEIFAKDQCSSVISDSVQFIAEIFNSIPLFPDRIIKLFLLFNQKNTNYEIELPNKFVIESYVKDQDKAIVFQGTQFEQIQQLDDKLNSLAKELKQLIPQHFIKLPHKFFSNQNGQTCADGSIGLTSVYFESTLQKQEDMYQILLMQATETIMHEIIHKKRFTTTSQCRYWQQTPEKFQPSTQTNQKDQGEAGDWFFKNLFQAKSFPIDYAGLSNNEKEMSDIARKFNNKAFWLKQKDQQQDALILIGEEIDKLTKTISKSEESEQQDNFNQQSDQKNQKKQQNRFYFNKKQSNDTSSQGTDDDDDDSLKMYSCGKMRLKIREARFLKQEELNKQNEIDIDLLIC